MKSSTSMVSPGPSSPSIPSASSNADPIRSFGHFLDLITPAEFSKLLKARVRHLLTTWPPPQSVITSNSSTSTSLSPSSHSSYPSLDSIWAFAAFFRSQDSPPSSPTNHSVATSLSTLHHHLLALQTLLSFLSARELKDIVRARLSESGKDRALAVQGLMDVMRNPIESEPEDLTERDDPQNIAFSENDIAGNAGSGTEQVGTSPGIADTAISSDLIVINRKTPFRSPLCMTDPTLTEGRPPKKRQKLSPSDTLNEPSMAAQRPSSSSCSSQEQTLVSSAFAEPHPSSRILNSKGFTESIPHTSNVHPSGTTNDETVSNGGHDQSPPHTPNPLIKSGDLSGPILGHSSYGNMRDEDVNYENAVHHTARRVTLSDKEAQRPEGGNEAEEEVDGLVLTQLESESLPTMGPSSICSDIGHLRRRISGEREKTLSSWNKEESASKLYVSQGENRLRAAFGIPSKRSEGGKEPLEFTDSAGCEAWGSLLSETNRTVVHVPPSSSELKLGHLSASQRPKRCASRSSSRSRSFPRSTSDDRGSPPGPMLRTAVDWASGISNVVDKELDGPLAFRPGEIFSPENSDETVGAGILSPKAFTRSPGGGWEDDGAHVSDTEASAVDVGAAERQKLFIRLPARPKNRLAGPGVASEGAVTSSSSASAHVTPVSERGAKESPKSTATNEIYTADEVPEPSPAPAKSADLVSSNVIPMTTSAPAIVAPHAQYPVQYPLGSRPQSGSPGTLAHGPYAMPQHAYPQQHPYPGPWFGAMFYVPLHGHPPARPSMQPPVPPKVSSVPSRQASDVTGSARTGTEDQSSGSSVPPSAPGSSSVVQPPSFGGRKSLKRPEPEPPKPKSPPAPVLDPHVTYTDDVGVKESSNVKRCCFNCHGIQAPSWRKSKLTFGKILCNKCGIYESTHMTARPLKTRPRRSQVGAEGEGSAPKKRKNIKKLPATL